MDPVGTAPDEPAESPIRLTMSGGRITYGRKFRPALAGGGDGQAFSRLCGR